MSQSCRRHASGRCGASLPSIAIGTDFARNQPPNDDCSARLEDRQPSHRGNAVDVTGRGSSQIDAIELLEHVLELMGEVLDDRGVNDPQPDVQL